MMHAHSPAPELEQPVGWPPRIVTAASLFDGHDAAIHIVRRVLQSLGAELIHLGHDRSVDEIVQAAIEEDAQAVAVSSYQGGHMEFFGYLVARLRERGAGHVRVFGGGGGTILPAERAELQAAGVARIFGPEDGRQLGLRGMMASILEALPASPPLDPERAIERLSAADEGGVARLITWFERAEWEPPRSAGDRRSLEESRPSGASLPDAPELLRARKLLAARGARRPPVLGITGTGGAGKSSVLDELLLRIRRDDPELALGLLLVDPSRRRSGGALLGDRIRLNALMPPRMYARSLATRRAHLATSGALPDAIGVLAAAGYDLILVETAGIGQGDSEITDLADLSLYVMTPDYGAPSQLEKIDMLEFADLIALNKFDRRGGQDALRDLRKQWRRNHERFQLPDAEVPVFPTVAHRYGDPGVERLYRALAAGLHARSPERFARLMAAQSTPLADQSSNFTPPIPEGRGRYLAEISQSVRAYRAEAEQAAERAVEAQALGKALDVLPASADASQTLLRERHQAACDAVPAPLRAQLAAWPEDKRNYAADKQEYQVRGQPVVAESYLRSLAGTALPRVALPATHDHGELVRFFALNNLPGRFPFAAGVFPFKQQAEAPTRMFAGEGSPEQTNRRFHLLARNQPSVRLSTAFDSVTLYGRDPDERPDIYGKVGNSGVSVCCLDDAKKLYSGFDLNHPSTSVSMTINGPAPIVLAWFFNTAIDRAVEQHLRETGGLENVQRAAAGPLPRYRGDLPEGHDGRGLGLLGISGDRAVEPEVYQRIRRDVLRKLRGTVQADILKEDQAQNTCIFSVDFALRLMGDVQQYFVREQIQNFYSVSVSGYHIAEAGAHPITQLAFTLANAFTYLEYYLARGMAIDEVAPNFSFFFSHGLDAEYNVLGRVARRIWAIALRERYRAAERSQKLKYHIQTSGRSLHAQEMAWNDVRTTLQTLSALSDHCNSLHTNAFDEAVTTPTEQSVRSAVAIQLIVRRELGLLANENPLQGSYFIEQLSDAVEAAVLEEFGRLSERGGVLGSMETQYQRSRIQAESLEYESRKHSGELPIIGVNTFLSDEPAAENEVPATVRSSDADKRAQLEGLRAFQVRVREHTPAALARLQHVARSGGNVFEELMETVKVASLGQISDALFRVGGRYRRAL
ncbi:MAG TPA: methylmalonyl-CoA mutase family protein [Polyangiales bacterium]|nr:methylmalonyl-CoA mutase family protein [Polyangiales bacterium]